MKIKVRSDKTVLQLAVAIRDHLRRGKSRSEILEVEKISKAQYRHAIRKLGKFPEKNEEAFAHFLIGLQGRLVDVERDLEKARSLENFPAVAQLHRISHEIYMDVYKMALKCGFLKTAGENVDLGSQTFEVCFGDEKIKPNWPSIE